MRADSSADSSTRYDDELEQWGDIDEANNLLSLGDVFCYSNLRRFGPARRRSWRSSSSYADTFVAALVSWPSLNPAAVRSLVIPLGDRAKPAYFQLDCQRRVDMHFTLAAACIFAGMPSTVILDLYCSEHEIYLPPSDRPRDYGGLTIIDLAHELSTA